MDVGRLWGLGLGATVANLRRRGVLAAQQITPEKGPSKEFEDLREADTSISNRSSKIVRFRTLAVLFDLECEHRIDARGSCGGDAARDYRNRRQAERYRCERRGIVGRHAE